VITGTVRFVQLQVEYLPVRDADGCVERFAHNLNLALAVDLPEAELAGLLAEVREGTRVRIEKETTDV